MNAAVYIGCLRLLVICTLVTAMIFTLSFGRRGAPQLQGRESDDGERHTRLPTNLVGQQRLVTSNRQGPEEEVPLRWMAGGITGRSEGETLNWLQSLYQETFFSIIRNEHEDGNEGNHRNHSTTPSSVCSWSRDELVKVLLNVTKVLAAQGLEEAKNDCRVTLPGHLRAVCLLTAAMYATSPDQHFTDVPAFQQSYCAAWVSCIEWTRGRFNRVLTTELLRQVYHAQVLPMVLGNNGGDNLRQFDALQSQFLHGLVGDTQQSVVARGGGESKQRVKVNLKEVEWMWRRALVHDAHHKKIANIHNVHEYARSQGKKTKLPREGLSPTSLQPTELSALFQGKSTFAFAEDDQDVKLMDVAEDTITITTTMTENGNPTSDSGGIPRRPLQYLTSLQIVATLYHILHAHDNSDNTAAGAHPLVPIIVFYGDSTNRELFYAIVNAIRRGFEVAAMRRQGYFHPNVQHRMNYDVVYRLFETHDEVILFDSPTTRHYGHSTIESFLEEMVYIAKAQGNQEGNNASTRNLLPLVVMVFLWDPWTYRPRRVMDMSSIGLPDESYCTSVAARSNNGSKAPGRSSYCQRNLLEQVHISIPLAVQGTSFWEGRLGPPLLRGFSFPTNAATSPRRGHHGSLYVLTSFAHNHLQPLARHFTPPVILTTAMPSHRNATTLPSEESSGLSGHGALHKGRCNSTLFLFDVPSSSRVHGDMHMPPEAQKSQQEMRDEMDRVELTPPSVLSSNGEHHLSKKCTNRQVGKNVNLF